MSNPAIRQQDDPGLGDEDIIPLDFEGEAVRDQFGVVYETPETHREFETGMNIAAEVDDHLLALGYYRRKAAALEKKYQAAVVAAIARYARVRDRRWPGWSGRRHITSIR